MAGELLAEKNSGKRSVRALERPLRVYRGKKQVKEVENKLASFRDELNMYVCIRVG